VGVALSCGVEGILRRLKRYSGGAYNLVITSVTEVIEVIGYQPWPYLAGRLGEYRTFNPENWIRKHIGEAYQDDEPTLEISGIPVRQNDAISGGSALHLTGRQGQIKAPLAGENARQSSQGLSSSSKGERIVESRAWKVNSANCAC
jgi:hypothetical protein